MLPVALRRSFTASRPSSARACTTATSGPRRSRNTACVAGLGVRTPATSQMFAERIANRMVWPFALV
jgi:hypothetical protein